MVAVQGSPISVLNISSPTLSVFRSHDRDETRTSLIQCSQPFTKESVRMALENYQGFATKQLILSGGQRRDRTAAASLFRAPTNGTE